MEDSHKPDNDESIVVSPIADNETEEETKYTGASGQESKDMQAMATAELEGSKDSLDTNQLGGIMDSISQLKTLAGRNKKSMDGSALTVDPELISSLASEMNLSYKAAENILRANSGDFEKSLLYLINV